MVNEPSVLGKVNEPMVQEEIDEPNFPEVMEELKVAKEADEPGVPEDKLVTLAEVADVQESFPRHLVGNINITQRRKRK